MAQTAVEWLIHELNTRKKPLDNSQIDELFEKAKAIEKEQIIDSAVQYLIKHRGMQSEQSILTAAKLSEQYYNETYGK